MLADYISIHTGGLGATNMTTFNKPIPFMAEMPNQVKVDI